MTNKNDDRTMTETMSMMMMPIIFNPNDYANNYSGNLGTCEYSVLHYHQYPLQKHDLCTKYNPTIRNSFSTNILIY